MHTGMLCSACYRPGRAQWLVELQRAGGLITTTTTTVAAATAARSAPGYSRATDILPLAVPWSGFDAEASYGRASSRCERCPHPAAAWARFLLSRCVDGACIACLTLLWLAFGWLSQSAAGSALQQLKRTRKQDFSLRSALRVNSRGLSGSFSSRYPSFGGGLRVEDGSFTTTTPAECRQQSCTKSVADSIISGEDCGAAAAAADGGGGGNGGDKPRGNVQVIVTMQHDGGVNTAAAAAAARQSSFTLASQRPSLSPFVAAAAGAPPVQSHHRQPDLGLLPSVVGTHTAASGGHGGVGVVGSRPPLPPPPLQPSLVDSGFAANHSLLPPSSFSSRGSPFVAQLTPQPSSSAGGGGGAGGDGSRAAAAPVADGQGLAPNALLSPFAALASSRVNNAAAAAAAGGTAPMPELERQTSAQVGLGFKGACATSFSSVRSVRVVPGLTLRRRLSSSFLSTVSSTMYAIGRVRA
jgi:hypothetical protein